MMTSHGGLARSWLYTIVVVDAMRARIVGVARAARQRLIAVALLVGLREGDLYFVRDHDPHGIQTEVLSPFARLATDG
jgi:hypothetical protein